MKSTNEIILMLADELTNHLHQIKSIDERPKYYNGLLGDTSFLLAGLLFSILKRKYTEWKYDKWIDDSLLTNVVIEESNLIIDGMIIFGRAGVNKQWVDYFSFKVDVFKGHVNLNKFSFLFGLVDSPEISYEDFKNNRELHIVCNKKWKYRLDS